MKNIFKRSKPPVIFDDGKEKVRVPECFRFDSDETTDFGQQVVMLLTLQPNAWRIHPGLRRFWHPELGEFMFDGSDRVRHLGASRDFEMHYASAVCPHALSQGDHNAIVEALRFFLTRAMDIGIAVEGEPPEPQVFRGKPPAVARKGDLLLDQGTIKKYDGTGWVEQAAAVAARNPFSVGGVAYNPLAASGGTVSPPSVISSAREQQLQKLQQSINHAEHLRAMQEALLAKK